MISGHGSEGAQSTAVWPAPAQCPPPARACLEHDNLTNPCYGLRGNQEKWEGAAVSFRICITPCKQAGTGAGDRFCPPI